jgi:SAM-dependent methyltransferase|tara:strand:+ start:209 stop:1015 length:807 start_codon:yes stop_codon:yes gene_type:complete
MPLGSDIAKAYRQYYTHTPNQADDPGTGTSIFKAIQLGYAMLLGCAAERSSMEAYFLDKETPGRVLEVGSGNGVRLKRLVDLGWDGEGQEIDVAAADLANSLGLQVHSGSIYDTCFSGKKYDRIVSNHVLEHLHDPAEVMTRCRELLDEKGEITVITPNICSFGSRLFGRNWRGLEPPRHIQIYSPASLRQLLLNCGYSEISVFSSAARADLVMTGSVNLALFGSHTSSHDRPSLVNAVMTALLWILARLSTFIYRDSGEELVAKARK